MNKERIEQIARELRVDLAVTLRRAHTPEFLQVIESRLSQAVNEALEEACQVVYGQCDNDNVAQRTVDAIRRLKV